MTTFRIRVAMDVRAYGVIDVEAESAESAEKIATAEYVADNFTPHGSGNDDYDFTTPRAIWLELAENIETGEETQLDTTVDAPWEAIQ